MPSRASRPILTRSGLLALALLGALVANLGIASPAPASSSVAVEGQGVALASSASCVHGDIDASYAARGASDAAVSFTSELGETLGGYAGAAYLPDHIGTEHVLTDASPVPAPGTTVAVYFRVGDEPPTAATTAEFFVLYRCDAVGNDAGGHNEVLETCFGPYGRCPQTALQALGPDTDAVVPHYTG